MSEKVVQKRRGLLHVHKRLALKRSRAQELAQLEEAEMGKGVDGIALPYVSVAEPYAETGKLHFHERTFGQNYNFMSEL